MIKQIREFWHTLFVARYLVNKTLLDRIPLVDGSESNVVVSSWYMRINQATRGIEWRQNPMEAHAMSAFWGVFFCKTLARKTKDKNIDFSLISTGAASFMHYVRNGSDEQPSTNTGQQ